ncbi:hypothetical protein GOBAR_DD14829 [Gossypium barbadense]|nr:hypothetical protein GOBAR_DD14829 [Gossypium barbadense]
MLYFSFSKFGNNLQQLKLPFFLLKSLLISSTYHSNISSIRILLQQKLQLCKIKGKQLEDESLGLRFQQIEVGSTTNFRLNSGGAYMALSNRCSRHILLSVKQHNQHDLESGKLISIFSASDYPKFQEPKLRDIIESEFCKTGSLDEAIKLVKQFGGIERAQELAKEKADIAIRSLQCLPQSDFWTSEL